MATEPANKSEHQHHQSKADEDDVKPRGLWRRVFGLEHRLLYLINSTGALEERCVHALRQ